jgi:hypothetical protein
MRRENRGSHVIKSHLINKTEPRFFSFRKGSRQAKEGMNMPNQKRIQMIAVKRTTTGKSWL